MIPCPDCCTVVCLIGTDLFDTDLSQWTTGGSVSVSGGLLVMSGASSALFDSEPASEGDGVHIQTFPMLSTDPATLRVVVCRTDASNYLFLEIDRDGSDGTMQLGKRVGGVDTYLGAPVTFEDTGSELEGRSTVEVCYVPGAVQEPEELNQARYPTANSGVGWSNPENALTVADEVYAEDNLSADETTNALIFGTCNFLIPAGSTIDGVEVSVWAADQAPNNISDFEVYLWDGGVIGDNKATTAFLGGSAPPALERVYGGAADDWNAGLTPDIVNSDDFGISLRYKNTGGDSSSVVVDYVSITVYYTTPERQAGTLTAKFINSASPNTEQCIRAFGVDTTGGLGNGLVVVAGDWDFTEYHLNYHQSESRPDCPECCETVALESCPCCPEGDLSLSYDVDITSEVVTVDFAGFTGFGGINGCYWQYEDEDVSVTLTLIHSVTGASNICYWLADVWILSDDPPTNTVYRSTHWTFGAECPEYPVTLFAPFVFLTATIDPS